MDRIIKFIYHKELSKKVPYISLLGNHPHVIESFYKDIYCTSEEFYEFVTKFDIKRINKRYWNLYIESK